MLQVILQAQPEIPKTALPVDWQNYIIGTLIIVIIFLVGFILKGINAKHKEGIDALKLVANANTTVSESVNNFTVVMSHSFEGMTDNFKDMHSDHASIKMRLKTIATNSGKLAKEQEKTTGHLGEAKLSIHDTKAEVIKNSGRMEVVSAKINAVSAQVALITGGPQ